MSEPARVKALEAQNFTHQSVALPNLLLFTPDDKNIRCITDTIKDAQIINNYHFS